MSERLLLHAERLEVHHTKNGDRVTFKDPCPF
jgi:23S rRNA-/tRNA-specific pseudouridylate synthase